MRKDSLIGGEVFGRLTVLRLHHSAKRKDGRAGERIMLCKCVCGNEIQVKTSNLKSGNTKSCGCLHSDMSVKSNLKRSGKVEDLEDDIGFACDCGCVTFNVLKSKSIECSSCTARYKLSSVFS